LATVWPERVREAYGPADCLVRLTASSVADLSNRHLTTRIAKLRGFDALLRPKTSRYSAVRHYCSRAISLASRAFAPSGRSNPSTEPSSVFISNTTRVRVPACQAKEINGPTLAIDREADLDPCLPTPFGEHAIDETNDLRVAFVKSAIELRAPPPSLGVNANAQGVRDRDDAPVGDPDPLAALHAPTVASEQRAACATSSRRFRWRSRTTRTTRPTCPGVTERW
jgi:hypothetical protein